MQPERSVLKLMLLVFFIVSTSSSAFINVSAHQNKPNPQCPRATVTCPDSVLKKSPLTFNANITGGDSNVTPTYNWSVSAGTIASGQGTPMIQVDTSQVEPNSTITATVEIGGFSPECGYGSTTSSCTGSVIQKAEAQAQKIDEYGALAPKDRNARLQNFVIALQNDPTAQGYVIAYNGRKSLATASKKATTGATIYLVKTIGIAADRVKSVEGGYREEPMTELWVVPSGATAPEATPTLTAAEIKPTASKKATKPAAKPAAKTRKKK